MDSSLLSPHIIGWTVQVCFKFKFNAGLNHGLFSKMVVLVKVSFSLSKDRVIPLLKRKLLSVMLLNFLALRFPM